MENRVVVTGLGLISPIGNDVAAFWDGLKNGRSGIDRIKSFDSTRFDSQIAGEVKDFNPESFGITKKALHHMEKFVQFAVASSAQAFKDSGLDLERENRERIGVVVGSGIGSLRIMEEQHNILLAKGPSRMSPFLIPMLIVNEAAGHIGITFKLKGPNTCITTACATGNHAIGEGLRIIQRGDADVIIAGGTESCVTTLGIGGFCALKALSNRNDQPQKASRPFDAQRNGFVMGEGCGLAILENLEHAKKRNAHIYCEVVGFGMSCDAYHITAPDPEGNGASLAMNWAIRDAKINPEDVDYINAHGTSTKLNDKIETMAIKRSFGEHAKKIMVSSTKSMTGHLLGAAAGIEFIACCLAIKYGVVPPTINYEYPDPDCDLDYVPNVARQAELDVCLSNSLGFGGHNATIAVKKFKG